MAAVAEAPVFTEAEKIAKLQAAVAGLGQIRWNSCRSAVESVSFYPRVLSSLTSALWSPCSENEKSGFVSLVSRYLRYALWVLYSLIKRRPFFVLLSYDPDVTLIPAAVFPLSTVQWRGTGDWMEQDPDSDWRSRCALRDFGASSRRCVHAFWLTHVLVLLRGRSSVVPFTLMP